MVTIVECSQGALFEALWVPLASVKAIRLGRYRLQRCPVHHRWQLVHRVDPATLSAEQRTSAARYPAGRLP